jgi:spermidine synthase
VGPALVVTRTTGAFWLLLGALVCSGAAGLTYQVLWLRMLALVFGVTAYAASTVLAGFMAGLALGSVLGGRLARRARHPLLLLALAELAIAVTALATHAVIGRLPGAFGQVVSLTGDHPAALTLVRLAGTLLVLIVPTTMMGATLPLVVTSRLVRAGIPAARIAAAYATNTAGAIIGAVATGFFLIGSLGIQRSFWLAAGANLAAATIALALWWANERRAGEPAGDAPRDTADLARHAAARTTPARRAVLVVLWMSGLASLALEVVWFRILVLFVPATTYAFTTMLAAVLAGVATGSWVAAHLLRRPRDWVRLLLSIQVATSVVILASLSALGWTYGAGWRTSGQIQASVLAIFPAALLMGLSFPIGVRIWIERDAKTDGPSRHIGGDLGTIYGVNVCGAILGALIGGFLLLPLLGTRVSLIVCAAAYLGCAGVLALVSVPPRAALSRVALALLPFGVLAWLVPDPFVATLARRHGAGERIVWREEGIQTTVAVHRQAAGRFVLYLDGLHQANDSAEMLQTHRLIGHLPMVLHPDPRSALVVGLGGGATAGAVSRHRRTAVDIVELSSSVRRGARFFVHANDAVLTQPNVRIRVDDGRNYLLTTSRRYDVLTADIIQPIHAGAGLLYSVEYYRLARGVLADGGVMLQWVGHRTPTQYGLIVRSFLAAFPETTAWAGGTLLVGSTRPLVLSRSAFERRRQDPGTRDALDAVGLDSFEALLALYAAGPRALAAFVGEGGILSDDRPRLEYHRSLPAERGDIDFRRLTRDLAELKVVD